MIEFLLALQLVALAPESTVASGIWCRPVASPDFTERAVIYSAGSDTFARWIEPVQLSSSAQVDRRTPSLALSWDGSRVFAGWGRRDASGALKVMAMEAGR